jgi:acyl-CoA synthetase (AMP-forming)/AMP-acid ligase II
MCSEQRIKTLADLPRHQALKYADRVAFVSDRETTYREFNWNTNRVANALLSERLSPTARIALLAKDSERCFEVIFGAAKANTVSLGINWRLAPSEIRYIINDAQTEVLFVDQEFFSKIETIRHELASVRKIIALSGEHSEWPSYSDWLKGASDVDPETASGSEDVVVQMYTSGTTGHPKGVMLANRSFFAMVDQMDAIDINWFDWSPDDVSLLNIPTFHIGGLWWAVRGLASGAKNVVMDTFVAWKALDLIRRYGVTKACFVPAMLQLMLAEPACRQTNLSSMNHIAYGGAPIALSTLQDAMKTFGCKFTQLYGMTETGNMAVNLPHSDHVLEGSQLMGSAGKALAGVELKVIDRDGNSLTPFNIGEICIKSPANMIGYWNLDEATAQTLIDGWIHTGDAGYLDEAGYLFICDRIKDMIIYAGENVYPAEIESVISSHQDVSEVAVIGVPDARWGESIKALVVLKPNAKTRSVDIIAHSRKHIADFKVPKSVEFVNSLPRTPSGKLRKAEIRAPYWKGHERMVN